MNKKLIISLSIVFSVIAVILILFWTLFALSSVSVVYGSSTINLKLTEKEIVEAGEFRYGACVFFDGKSGYLKNIEKKVETNPNFAYLRVVNIETVFPNKYIIHVSEREELFAVKHNGQVYVCDRDLRVLKKSDAYSSNSANPILLDGLTIKNQQIEVGDFLEIEEDAVKKFYSHMISLNRDLAQQIGKFKEIKLEKYEDHGKNYTAMTLTTFQNRKFIINNIDFAFKNKLNLMFSAESTLYSQKVSENGIILDSSGEEMFVYKSENNELLPAKNLSDEDKEKTEIIALTYDLISKCNLKVDNLTLSDFVNRTENDIYYSLIEQI